MKSVFAISQMPGKSLVADALSRAPSSESIADDHLFYNLSQKQKEDELCQKVVEYCMGESRFSGVE